MKKTWSVLRIKNVFVFALLANMVLATCMAVVQPTKVSAAADTCTWTGGGSDDNFSTAANWTGCDNGTVPENGDILEFDVSSLTGDTVANNDLVSLSIAGINMTGTAVLFPSIEVTGNPITITGNLTGDNVGGTVNIGVDITLGSNVTYSVPEGRLFFYSSTGIPDFNIQSHNFTVTTTSSEDCDVVRMQSSLVGSGQLITNSGAIYLALYESASGFSGSVVSNGKGVVAYKGNVVSAGASVTINGSGKIILAQENSDPTTDYVFDVVMNSSANPALLADSTAAYCSGGPSTAAGNSTLSGDLTLQTDTVFSGAHNLNVTGAYTANAHALTVKAGSGGSITTSSGTIGTTEQTTTISAGDVSSGTEEVGNKETLILNGTRGTVNVRNGGVLKGTGVSDTIVVFAGGKLSPGQSPGCMTVGSGSGALQFNSGSSFDVEIAGTTACTGYDQVVVNGSVNVTNATLNVTLLNGFNPSLNSTFTIISNDGTDAVTGTFTGLAQGASVVVGGVTFHISYTGGDGNDVVLTAASVPSSATAPNTGIAGLNRSIVLPLIVVVVTGLSLIVIRKKFAATR